MLCKVQIDTEWLFVDGGINSHFKNALKDAILKNWDDASLKSESFDTFSIEIFDHTLRELCDYLAILAKEIMHGEDCSQWIKVFDSREESVENNDQALYEQISDYAELEDIFNSEEKSDIAIEEASESVTEEIEYSYQKIVQKSGIQKLNELIGLSTIKRDVVELVNFVQVQRKRQMLGKKAIPISLHMVFTGNPGTGKTSVARIIAQIYNEIGVLPTPNLVEVDRAQLVAGYVGQTAIKTKKKIDEAKGGILFIDEAYTLSKGDGNDYGQEAIDTILKAMEDLRDNLIVIVAGYTEKMGEFINSNPGLRSRFNRYIEFPDYSSDELLQIFLKFCSDNDYEIDPDALIYIKDKLRVMTANKNAGFANARDIRNMFECILMRQASRIASLEDASERTMSLICIEDLE